MKTALARGTFAAVTLALGTVAFAQSTGQTQPPTTTPQTSAATQDRSAEQVTITGCVQREADYRTANNLGTGGVAGTGVGANNEFVLINASIGAGAASSTIGTSGNTNPTTDPKASAAASMAYELSGQGEGQLSQYVGKRVQITGKIKAAEMGAAGATGGTTAGAPPTGVDVASKDLKLKEIDVISVKEATGTCPAK